MIIYDPQRQHNEEPSVVLAAERMRGLAVPEQTVQCCCRQIPATATHQVSTDSDTNYFTDADQSVLGQPWPQYELYYKGIRQEYSCYSDSSYNTGPQQGTKAPAEYGPHF